VGDAIRKDHCRASEEMVCAYGDPRLVGEEAPGNVLALASGLVDVPIAVEGRGAVGDAARLCCRGVATVVVALEAAAGAQQS
jgi:hypothetical protein